MLLFALLAIVILLCVLATHYRHHFMLQVNHCISFNASCDNIQTMGQTHTRTAKKSTTHRYCCRLKKRNEFNFFPTSFLLYLQFIIVLCLLVITVEILNYYDTNTSESVTDLLFGYSHKSYSRNAIYALHQVTRTHTPSHSLYVSVYIIDHILIYGIMISSTWESLFSFYRYYTTAWCSHHCRLVSTSLVIRRFFLYYGVLFCALFICTIHLSHFIFPLVIILHISFNFYCTFKFASILTERYKHFIAMDVKTNSMSLSRTFNYDMLKSVYFMKYVSITCCVLQSMYLTLLLVTYDVNVVYYIPSIWSIQCIALSLTFVRNRECVFEYYQSVKHSKYICCIQRKEMPLKKELNSQLKSVDSDSTDAKNRSPPLPIVSNVKSRSDYALYDGVRGSVPLPLKQYKSHPQLGSTVNEKKALQLLGVSAHRRNDLETLQPTQSFANRLWTNLGQRSHPMIYSKSPKKEEKATVGDDDDAFVFNEYDCDPKEAQMDIEIDFECINIDEVENELTVPGIFMSKSAPMHSKLIKNEDELDMFDILVQYGFCSIQRINSAKQLHKYRLQSSGQN